jgi:hypothetical protein
MSHSDYETMEREIAERLYTRHAAGGFARAALESREADGTFFADATSKLLS